MLLPKKDRLMIANRVYRHKIEIWKLDGEEKNEAKEIIQVPTLFCTLWADVVPIRGKEYVSMDTLVPEMQYKITSRYRPGVDQSMIIKWQGRELNIKAIIDISGQEEEMELMCVERVEIDG